MTEWAGNGDSETRVWMMVGLLVRVALQMGYHRYVATSIGSINSDFDEETLRSIRKLPYFKASYAGEFGPLCRALTF